MKKVKVFYSTNGVDLENQVNHFLKAIKDIDLFPEILFSADNAHVNVIIIYKEML